MLPPSLAEKATIEVISPEVTSFTAVRTVELFPDAREL
jgi:hypothetical protein